MSSNIYSEQDKNVHKTWFLMAVFLVVVIALGWFLSFYFQNQAVLYLAIALSIGMNITSYWFADKIALSVSRAKPITKEQFPDLWNVVENLSITAGLPMPRLYIIEDQAPNAFATGRNKEHAAVAVTTGLLSIMNKTELEGVIAHELSHVGNKDILISTIVVVLVGFIALISDMLLRARLFGFGGHGNRDRGQAGAIIMFVGILLAVLSPIAATLIQLSISRKREFLADASGALLTRYPEGLASALEKLKQSDKPMQSANKATSHLFISNPFGEKTVSGMSKLFMTHPPLEERIRILRGM